MSLCAQPFTIECMINDVWQGQFVLSKFIYILPLVVVVVLFNLLPYLLSNSNQYRMHRHGHTHRTASQSTAQSMCAPNVQFSNYQRAVIPLAVRNGIHKHIHKSQCLCVFECELQKLFDC